jgi:hypothetical protein
LAISMATAAILKKSTLKSTTSHGIWYFYKVLSRHLWEIKRTKMCGRIRIIVKKKRRIAIHPDSSQGDVIRNGANTICLPNIVWGT